MKTKPQVTLALAFMLCLLAGIGLAGSVNGYRVTEPPAFPIFNTNHPSQWAASNGISVVWTAGGSGCLTNDCSNFPSAVSISASAGKICLVESAIASPFEHVKPEYYLGDAITLPPNIDPANIDWAATFALLTNSAAYSNNAVFYDRSVPAIYFSEGGLIQVAWVLTSGSSETNCYQVSSSPRKKPYRIFWTDEPYNSPPVDLSGKHVRFFGDPDVLNLGYEASTAPGVSNVVKGLFLDPVNHWLNALGGIKGSVVMAYYSTGNFDDLLGTIVVEVCAPDKDTITASIGSQLLPTGDGYDVDGLTAQVTEGLDDEDERGAYVYQHNGDHSYSPNNGCLYATRKNLDAPWKIEVYWRQTDLMGTVWPFEVLNYACDWPTDCPQYVRGVQPGTNGTDYGVAVPIPSAYTPELMAFQEPDGHAILGADSTFLTRTNGYSLLKLTGTDKNGDDNVWFVPVHSILRDDPEFDLTPGDWPVGVEVFPLPTAMSLAFDGTSAYLQTGITNELRGSFTVEAYFQCRKTTTNQTLFFKSADSGNSTNSLDFKVEVEKDGTVRATLGSTSLVDAVSVAAHDPIGFGTTWHHVSLVYDQGTTNCTLYLDRVPANTLAPLTNSRPGIHAGTLYIGMNATVDTNATRISPFYLNGNVDDIRVWNRALTTTEITNNLAAHGFLHTATTDTNLVAYYPIDNGLGRVVKDASTNGLDAQMVNCTRVASGAFGLEDADVKDLSPYHGYIYEPVSGSNYNPKLYVRPDAPSTNADGSASESYIFAVNKTPDGGKPLEIWWSSQVLQTAMPEPIWFPSWVQCYRFGWLTNDFSYPQIVLASQEGSANPSLVKRGAAVDFSKSVNSKMTVPAGDWFAGDTGSYSVECWVNPHSFSDAGQVFDFGNNGPSSNRVALTILRDGHIQYLVTGTTGEFQMISPTNAPPLRCGWNHLALVVANRQATVYQDSLPVLSNLTVSAWSDQTTTNNYLAVSVQGGVTNSFDGQIDEFAIWGVARSDNDVTNDMLSPLTGTELGLRLYYSFDNDVGDTSEANSASDLVKGTLATIDYADWVLPGAPRADTGVLFADDAPFVYYQNDARLPGYNPNEEHAFVQAGSGGYVTYALRCDLNQDDSSGPYVLVQYNDPNNNGYPAMQVYQVVATNHVYPNLAATMTAGGLVPGPHPLDLLPDPWNIKTYWSSAAHGKNSFEDPAYRDRKLQIWGKRAGPDGASAELDMHNFYPLQDGFFFPSLTNNQPTLGTPVPWLCRFTDKTANVTNGNPAPWTWTVNWPSNSPVIKIGQTLTKAALGLPEVWGAKSMKLLYTPQSNSVALYDPVVFQTAGFSHLDLTPDFGTYFGFSTGPHGNTTLKNGNTYFKGVPPNVSDRFFFDPAAAQSNCLKLAGRLVEDPGGFTYLQLNVLNTNELAVLQGLATAHTNMWISALAKFAANRRDTDDEHAVANYALTHMGPGAGASNYVTLIENDNTNKLFGVNDGDPINMHIIQLSTNLFAGNVKPLTDPNDLLSEQLDILYTESFAGDASDYEFQWKRAEPNANGTTPTDYLDQYKLYIDQAGVTRFTIGKEGDTLPDMVNNFYVMRYRALPGTDAFAPTGGAWSDWIGPTLAEGWVERVVNGVTPYTQRMQDLYNNPAETAVSMIQQAGAPYEGDVALNQDNLTSVGLIQLYQTVLNKAESMSLTLGIDDTAADQQLMLAATRLNDLYMLLGNEAYADAMDPTIGFGSDYVNTGSLSLGGVDYGALSSSLFCFDNQCPNLREEELSLLRGRSDAQLAPSLQFSPTYNRLYWNFTKGITAGEAAYAVNYQIQGDAVTIDQPQAAVLYPQGHGDAWGHYLSALTGYYRLMRNPHFSWGTPSITPMMVGDAVVDADYYDEEKFAESAAAMARTGVEVIRHTCEKSYVENSGAALAGYFDQDQNRAFGYGEWGARAGLCALYNWAAANSLLPPQVDPTAYDFFTFATNTQLACQAPSSKVDFSSDFTIEFKINPDADLQGASGNCCLFDWYSRATPDRTANGAIGITLEPSSGNLYMNVPGVSSNVCIGPVTFGAWTHVAVTYSADRSTLTFLINGAQQGVCPNVYMGDTLTASNAAICLAANDSPVPFSGLLSEFRVWNVARAASDLVAARDGVSANADGLLMYQRFIADSAQGAHLPDESCGAAWLALNPVWQPQSDSGVALAFVDNSILRINRDSVGSLDEIVSAIKDVQHSVDVADAGMTPLGLSDSAIPFDIDPAELAAGKSHFEQISERAEQALANAATLLDRAQGISKLQRRQTQNAINVKQDLDNEETALALQLIGIFGYPYDGDIGAGGTYPQGYDGPDLYHYMWMDLEQYGFKSFELEIKESKVYQIESAPVYWKTKDSMTLKFDLTSNGMILKPSGISGTRRAQGRLQSAYGAFIQTYLANRKALLDYDDKAAFLLRESIVIAAQMVLENAVEAVGDFFAKKYEYEHITKMKAELDGIARAELRMMSATVNYTMSANAVPHILIAGMSDGGSIDGPQMVALRERYAAPIKAATEEFVEGKCDYGKGELGKNLNDDKYEWAKDTAERGFEILNLNAENEKLIIEVNDAATALDVANAALINAQESYLSVLAEGEQLLSKREALRKQACNRIAAGRYQDMAFRTFRSDALANYGNAFDLAKKYTYLATKAYDYETALGLTNAYGSDSIFCKVVGARNLGFMKDDVAQLGGLHGDGGLADILARLKANWLVLKGRLGINNPQIEQNWLSLRSECFRIEPAGTLAAKAWQDRLSSCQVDNLLAYPEFQRYCLSFESSTGLLPQEPALVIPFSTSIDFARNVFGWDLAGNDHTFDSSYYATKIRKMGVKFIGYNTTTNGVVALSATPRVYLIPVGNDVMRSPGKDGGDLLAYNVVDQVVPLPFPLGTSSLDDPDWTSIYTAYTGSGDPMATIRRYPSLRAYYDQSADAEAMLSNTRLVGRSVWNTRWLLIIPAGALHADRAYAIETLIRGADFNKDGKIDQPGIQDIQIGFETYSNSGN